MTEFTISVTVEVEGFRDAVRVARDLEQRVSDALEDVDYVRNVYVFDLDRLIAELESWR